MRNRFPFRPALISLIGVTILAFGISICRISHCGTDPFTSMNTGVSETIGMSLALYQGLFNIALFAILILADRKNLHFIHIGAVFNMFLPGMPIISDTAAAAVAFIFGGPLGIATIILMLFTGPLISFWNRKVSEPVVKKFGRTHDSQSFDLQHPVSDTDMSLNILR